MQNLLARLTLGTLLLAPLLQAAEDPQQKYQACVACHGNSGQGNPALGAPALAAQDKSYLERQLHHFKRGVRGADARDTVGAAMAAIAITLADEDIPALSAYLAALPVPVLVNPLSGDLKNGNNYYQSKCGACHGGRAQGNPGLNAPALAWLDTVYLRRQYRYFQLGVRGAHPEDRYGRQMKMMSTTLPSEQDLVDVIAFVQSLAPAP